MNFQELMNKKIDKQNKLVNKALKEERGLTKEEQDEFNQLEEEITNLRKTIEMQNKLNEPVNEPARIPVNQTTPDKPKKDDSNIVVKDEMPHPFINLGEQLKAVKHVAENGVADERLIRLNNAAAGMNEAVPDEGKQNCPYVMKVA